MGLLEKLGKIKKEFNEYKKESKQRDQTKKVELKKSLKEEIEMTKLQTKLAKEKAQLKKFEPEKDSKDWFGTPKKKNFGGFEKNW